MKLILIGLAFVVAACKFQAGGVPCDCGPDGSIDAVVDGQSDGGAIIDAAPDAALTCAAGQGPSDQAGCQPYPSLLCSLDTDSNGIIWRRIDFSGWITAGALDAPPAGVSPQWIAYGSDFDSSTVMSSCNDLWKVPYPSGCGKPMTAWLGEPDPDGQSGMVLKFAPEVENFNIALIYADGTVRWADIAVDDGTPDRFVVGGSGSGYNCHIVHPASGGGIIRVAP